MKWQPLLNMTSVVELIKSQKCRTLRRTRKHEKLLSWDHENLKLQVVTPYPSPKLITQTRPNADVKPIVLAQRRASSHPVAPKRLLLIALTLLDVHEPNSMVYFSGGASGGSTFGSSFSAGGDSDSGEEGADSGSLSDSGDSSPPQPQPHVHGGRDSPSAKGPTSLGLTGPPIFDESICLCWSGGSSSLVMCCWWSLFARCWVLGVW